MDSPCLYCKGPLPEWDAYEIKRVRGDNFDLVTTQYENYCDDCSRFMTKTKVERDVREPNYSYSTLREENRTYSIEPRDVRHNVETT